jgi:hypothetical protein
MRSSVYDKLENYQTTNIDFVFFSSLISGYSTLFYLRENYILSLGILDKLIQSLIVGFAINIFLVTVTYQSYRVYLWLRSKIQSARDTAYNIPDERVMEKNIISALIFLNILISLILVIGKNLQVV